MIKAHEREQPPQPAAERDQRESKLSLAYIGQELRQKQVRDQQQRKAKDDARRVIDEHLGGMPRPGQLAKQQMQFKQRHAALWLGRIRQGEQPRAACALPHLGDV